MLKLATMAAVSMLLCPQSAQAKLLEQLTDRCSTSVRIEPALIYSGDASAMVPGSQDPIRLHRTSPSGPPNFSEKRTVGLSNTGRFAWYCGPKAHLNGGTLEHSRCPVKTNVLRARLGADRLLRIECHSD